MDLILWRHGDEIDHGDDAQRPLSLRGKRQVEATARWLSARAPQQLRVICSPARRARQSAELLQRPIEISARIGPQARAADLLAAADWPHGAGKRGGAVLLVGHQPALGELAALLLGDLEAQWTIKKGALWWFGRRVRGEAAQTFLRAAIGPDLADPT